MNVAQTQALVLADVVVICQAPANRPLRDLDVGCQLAAVKHRVTQARAQGDDHFETAARDRASASDFGIVENLGGQAEGPLNRPAHIEVVPQIDQLGQHARARSIAGDVVRGRDDDAVADHSRHTHRHSRRSGKLTREANNSFHEKLRRQRVGSGHPARRGHHRATLIHHGALNATAAAVNRQRHLTSHGFRLPDTARAGHSLRNVRPNARVDQ